MALADFMRPSLRKGAYADASSAAWQEIRVRSGRDDKSLVVHANELSSRPKRSVVEGPAVSFSDFTLSQWVHLPQCLRARFLDVRG
jgi:hypothetical protein